MFDYLANKKELRPHQQRAIDMLRQSLARGNRRVVVQAPTGFGKTLTAAKIVDGALAKGNRVIFTAPAISLIDQTVRAFEDEGITDVGVMQASHPRTDPMRPVQIASVQTLARREIPNAAMVIVDECHIRSTAIDALMAERDDVYFIGLSATPWAKGMGLRWQDMVTPCSLAELIEAGFLSRFIAYAPDIPDLTGVKSVGGDYVESALEEIMGDAKLVGNAVHTWLDKGEDRPTLCFGVNTAHAKRLQGQFQANGISAEYVDAFTDRVEREYINRRFREGEVRVICSVRTMTTGVDLPVSCIVDCAPTKSEMLHVQKIGRGLRVNEGTEDLIILDHAGNSIRLGLVTDIVHERLCDGNPPAKAEAREKLPKPCDNCGALRVGLICKHCGHVHAPATGHVTSLDGDLVALEGSTKAEPETRWSKQEFYSMAIWLDRKRGKGGKLAKGLYKGYFGVWPRGVLEYAMEPDQAFLNYEHARRIAYAKRMDKEREARNAQS
jgi:superfamily II DNA or RNA helicase